MKGLIHNSFFTRNERKENLSSLFGMEQRADETNEGRSTVIHSEKTGRTVILESVFPTDEIADEACRHLEEKWK